MTCGITFAALFLVDSEIRGGFFKVYAKKEKLEMFLISDALPLEAARAPSPSQPAHKVTAIYVFEILAPTAILDLTSNVF